MAKTTISGIYPKLINSPAVPHLKRSLHQFDIKKITAEELEEIIKKNISQAITEQRAAGINLLEDGLIRWDSFYSPFIYGWQGLERGNLKRIFDTNTLQRHPRIISEINYQETSASKDAAYAKNLLQAGEELKAILPGPISFTEDAEDEFYGDFGARLEALAKNLNQSLKAYEEAGVNLVEIYDPYLYFNEYNSEVLKNTYSILLNNINIKVILGSFYGTPKQVNLAALENTNLAGFSLDLVNNPESLNNLNKEPEILQLGILDARTTAQDDLGKIKNLIQEAQAKFPNAQIFLSLNNSPEFLPRESANKKMQDLTKLK